MHENGEGKQRCAAGIERTARSQRTSLTDSTTLIQALTIQK